MTSHRIVAQADHGKHRPEHHPHAPHIPTGDTPMPPRHAAHPHHRSDARHSDGDGGCLRALGRLTVTPAATVAAYLGLWVALIAVLLLGLHLDAATAGEAMAAAAGTGRLRAASTGWLRRRRDDDEQDEQDDRRSLAEELQPPRPQPRRSSPVESTDVLEFVVDEVDAAADDAMAVLRTERDVMRRQAQDARRYADQAARAATIAGERARRAELDRDEADRAAAALRRALDEHRPAPDPVWLGERLISVYHRPLAHPLPTSEEIKARRRNMGCAAIQIIRGPWPIEAWPLTEAERNAPADGVAADELEWPFKPSPGGGTETEDSPPAVSAPGDPTLEAAADRHLDDLAQILARRDLDLTRTEWPKLTDLLREYYRTLAADVVNAGWRPPRSVAGAEQRPVIAALLADHEQLADGTCRCGWGGPSVETTDSPLCDRNPLWHAEHVAEQLTGTGVLA